MPNSAFRVWRRAIAIAFMMVAIMGAIGWVLLGMVSQNRPSTPGAMVRREFALGILEDSNGTAEPFKDLSPKIIRWHLRKVARLKGTRVRAGSYSFTIPPGTTRLYLAVRSKKEPAIVGTVAYEQAASGWLPAKRVNLSQSIIIGGYSPPAGLIAVFAGRVLHYRAFLVPQGAAFLRIPFRCPSSFRYLAVRAPDINLSLGGGILFPRTIFRCLDSGGSLYTGFTLKRWWLALAECGVKPAEAKATMRRIIVRHLAFETDLGIERGILHVTWRSLVRQKRLGAAVWRALELQQLLGYPLAIWIDIPEGRRMVFYSSDLIVFNRLGRATLDGGVESEHGPYNLPTRRTFTQTVIPFFAQPSPPGLRLHD